MTSFALRSPLFGFQFRLCASGLLASYRLAVPSDAAVPGENGDTSADLASAYSGHRGAATRSHQRTRAAQASPRRSEAVAETALSNVRSRSKICTAHRASPSGGRGCSAISLDWDRFADKPTIMAHSILIESTDDASISETWVRDASGWKSVDATRP